MSGNGECFSYRFVKMFFCIRLNVHRHDIDKRFIGFNFQFFRNCLKVNLIYGGWFWNGATVLI